MTCDATASGEEPKLTGTVGTVIDNVPPVSVNEAVVPPEVAAQAGAAEVAVARHAISSAADAAPNRRRFLIDIPLGDRGLGQH